MIMIVVNEEVEKKEKEGNLGEFLSIILLVTD